MRTWTNSPVYSNLYSYQKVYEYVHFLIFYKTRYYWSLKYFHSKKDILFWFAFSSLHWCCAGFHMLLVTGISFRNFLFMPFVCFTVGLFIFVVLICRSILYIMTINPSFPIYIANIFSQTVTFLLTLLIASFVIREFLIFNKSVSLVLYGFWVGFTQEILSNFKLWKYCLVFFSRPLLFYFLYFRALIHPGIYFGNCVIW